MQHANEVKAFIEHHFRHFNSAALIDAARGYRELLDSGGSMFLTLAGAMSTAELGLSLAEMIRAGKVDAICCTGANLEEDVYNLVAHDHYVRVPHYRELTPRDEQDLLARHLNRVTDTCIPEEEAIRRIEEAVLDEWTRADAACERDLPIFVPGWEDSTSGNIFTSHCLKGTIANVHTVRTGVEYMMELTSWYRAQSAQRPIGFFQIGGGIAGDFPICVVPMLRQDMELGDTPLWSYFCQISDSTTSYGSYSGAVPNEKITWEKLAVDTPRFVIESDATIVAPLVFAYVLAEDED
jgi:deoxyhypusine synthase